MKNQRNFKPCAYLPASVCFSNAEKLALLCREACDSAFWLRLDDKARDFFVDVLFNRT